MNEEQITGLASHVTGYVTDYVSGKAHDISTHGKQAGLGLALQVVGGIPLVASAIIALGEALGDRYALSSLLVSIVLITTGVLIQRSAMNRLKNEDLRLARSPSHQAVAAHPASSGLSPTVTKPAIVSTGLALMLLGRILKNRAHSAR